MRPSHGLFVASFGFVIAVLSMAPIGVALFETEAPPALGDPWGFGTVTLALGIVWMLFGVVVMLVGVILAGVGVFTK